MCGVAGFVGIEDPKIKELVVWGLGDGVDRRGGHAAGYATVNADGHILVNRKQGMFGERRAWRFIRQAAQGSTILLHARYATCGALTPQNAHPFTIKRDGKTVLHGMHNGMIYNSRQSAKAHGREHTVDSKELFELLADEKYDEIAKLQGYGVIVWVRPEDPHRVYFCKLTQDADLAVVGVKGGGIAWASTRSILLNGLAAGTLEADGEFEIQHGVVHTIADGKVWVHEEFKLSLAAREVYSSFPQFDYSKWSDEDWDEAEADLLEDEEEVQKSELCALYGINESEVEDFTYTELLAFVTEWGMRSARSL